MSSSADLRLLLIALACCACSSEPSNDEVQQTVPAYNGPGAAAVGSNPTPPAGSSPAASSGSTGPVTSPSTGSPSEQGAMPTPIASGGAGGAATGATGAGMMGAAGAGMMTSGAAGSASMGSAGTGNMAMASGGAGGAPGAAGAGNVSPPPAVSSCPAAALFCDDFEDDATGQFPGAPWQNQTGSGATVTVDGVQAFSGSRAVHVLAPAGAYRRGYFSLVQGRSDIFPAASREMFGRAMMYLDATPNATVHWTILQGEGRAADGTHDAYYRYGGQQQNGAGLMANYETNMGVSTDCYSHSATRMPTRAWTCVEWHFKVATNEEQLWLNGNEVTDLHVIDRPTTPGSGCLGNGVNGEWLAPPQFTTLHLGWEQYQQTNNATNLWVDDVAISTQRLGCPAQ
jgi:hypothetical protein